MRRAEPFHTVTAPPNRQRPILTVPIELYREDEAAAYIGESHEARRKNRHQDMDRLERGEPIEGPPWIEIRKSSRKAIRYARQDLDAWIAALRRDCGVGFPPVVPMPDGANRIGARADGASVALLAVTDERMKALEKAAESMREAMEKLGPVNG